MVQVFVPVFRAQKITVVPMAMTAGFESVEPVPPAIVIAPDEVPEDRTLNSKLFPTTGAPNAVVKADEIAVPVSSVNVRAVVPVNSKIAPATMFAPESVAAAEPVTIG